MAAFQDIVRTADVAFDSHRGRGAARKERNMQRAFPSKRSAGFTLIELVIVILILGILSAVALPRFLNLGGDARRAKAEAIHGSVRAAAQIVRAGALVANQTGATGSVNVDGAAITTNHGYPTANDAGIVAAANLSATDDKVTITGGGATAGSSLTIQIDGASTPANCQVTYQSPASANNTPTITLVTDGC